MGEKSDTKKKHNYLDRFFGRRNTKTVPVRPHEPTKKRKLISCNNAWEIHGVMILLYVISQISKHRQEHHLRGHYALLYTIKKITRILNKETSVLHSYSYLCTYKQCSSPVLSIDVYPKDWLGKKTNFSKSLFLSQVLEKKLVFGWFLVENQEPNVCEIAKFHSTLVMYLN